MTERRSEPWARYSSVTRSSETIAAGYIVLAQARHGRRDMGTSVVAGGDQQCPVTEGGCMVVEFADRHRNTHARTLDLGGASAASGTTNPGKYWIWVSSMQQWRIS